MYCARWHVLLLPVVIYNFPPPRGATHSAACVQPYCRALSREQRTGTLAPVPVPRAQGARETSGDRRQARLLRRASLRGSGLGAAALNLTTVKNYQKSMNYLLSVIVSRRKGAHTSDAQRFARRSPFLFIMGFTSAPCKPAHVYPTALLCHYTYTSPARTRRPHAPRGKGSFTRPAPRARCRWPCSSRARSAPPRARASPPARRPFAAGTRPCWPWPRPRPARPA